MIQHLQVDFYFTKKLRIRSGNFCPLDLYLNNNEKDI